MMLSMQTINHLSNIKDTVQYGWISLGPESASSYMTKNSADSLSVVEKIALERLEQLKAEACEKSGINGDTVNINIHKAGSIALNYGNSKRTVLDITDRLLQGMVDRKSEGVINSLYQKSYRKKIDALPDDPAELQKRLNLLKKKEMYEWVGLDLKCNLWLSDEEIYFILKHELAGHSIHNDNLKRFGLTAIATVINFVSLPLLLDASSEYLFVVGALCIGAFAITKLAVERMINGQEYAADLAAVKDDPKALEGGLRFLKKGMIREGIKNRLNPTFTLSSYFGHPTYRDRYTQLLF